jgi:phosphoribosyl 1,2-cyclic phosphodiesterase
MTGLAAEAMRLRFWGVRGSLAAPGAATLRYGGNTPCLELRCGPHLLVLDAGTGLLELGRALLCSGRAVTADVLLSHTHLDHIIGLPFFGPIFEPGCRLRFWGGHLDGPGALEAALDRSWSAPLMPDMRRFFRAELRFEDFRAGAVLEPQPGLRVVTAALNHPGGCTGYRIEWGGRALAYATDTEHRIGELDPEVLRLARGANLLVYDASYSDAEFAPHAGWGHSTWEQGIRLADAAGTGRLVLFHHEPRRDDAALAAIEAAAAAQRPGTLAAREGLELVL